MVTGAEIFGPADWLAVFTHVKKWLSNLGRSGPKRKEESKAALRAIISTARETSSYIRDLRNNRAVPPNKEGDLAGKWTELSFILQDIGLTKLAKTCDIKGKYWATRNNDGTSDYPIEFLEKAGARLSDVEKAARFALQKTKR